MARQRSTKQKSARVVRGRKQKHAGLPLFLEDLFWEYDFNRLSWRRDHHLVIDKILAYGDWKSICWLRRKLGDEGLREWILQRRGRGLSPRQLRYWELILKLPHEVVDSWVETALKNSWYRRCDP